MDHKCTQQRGESQCISTLQPYNHCGLSMQSAKSLTTRTRWKTLTANWPMYWGEGVGNQAAFPYSIFYFPILKIIIITLIGTQLLYNVVLVSALHQRESIYLFGCTGSSLQCAGFLVVA